MRRFGIDVGGTNTDAVLIDGDSIVATTKVPTTVDVTGGVRAALRELADHEGGAALAPAAVMIGTTHFVTKQDYDAVRDGPIFLFVKAMRDRPDSVAEIEKKKDVIHIVLTGWKG